MKKLVSIFILVLVSVSVFAQYVDVYFEGMDSKTYDYVKLSRVEITNVTRGWTEYLIYPDTVAEFMGGNGIEENASNNVFGVSQNTPNPCNGVTNVCLTLTETGNVTLEIMDVTGRIVETLCTQSLPMGIHQFRINIADAGLYFLNARQNGKTSSVKMVNNGGKSNEIEYVGVVESVSAALLHPKNGVKGLINHPYALGDNMQYKGYAEKFGVEFESEIVETQLATDYFFLLFDYSCAKNPNDEQPCQGTPTLTDIDGNSYNTVELGSQCWMKENLKVKTYANGNGISESENLSTTTAYWRYPNSYDVIDAPMGLLYNWKAAMGNSSPSAANPSGVQGICPNGWHLPSADEYLQLAEYLNCQSEYVCDRDYSVADALASSSGWQYNIESCTPGYNQDNNNATNFSAFPVGMNGIEYGFAAEFWTTTEDEYDSNQASYMWLNYMNYDIFLFGEEKTSYVAVRCLKNN